MQTIKADGVVLHVADRGPNEAPTLVFSNTLGADDFRAWGPLLPCRPKGLKENRFV